MAVPKLEEQILKEIGQLTPALKRRVLDFAKSLAKSPPKGIPGSDLQRFFGVISHEDAQAMRVAIEEGCEQIDESGW